MTHRLAASFIAVVVAVACSHSRPMRLVAGIDDTVIVNSTKAVTIPLEAFDASGRPTPAGMATFEHLSGDPIRVASNGTVHCDRAGDARFRASLGTVSTTFMLYCRPMRHLAFRPTNYGLLIGGPPQPLEVVGVGLDGRPVTLLAARIGVDDSTIVSVDHGVIGARRRGMTTVRVQAGDARMNYVVQVLERAASPEGLQVRQAFIEAVTLPSGSSRTWPVTAGRYEVMFTSEDPVGRSVLLAANGANCARYPDGGPHLSCVVRDRGTIFVAVPASSPPRAPLGGRLVIRRLEERTTVNDYWVDARAYAFVK